MRTETINIYKFAELPPMIQQRILNKYRDVNTDDMDWWSSVYEDAENVGILIRCFNTYEGYIDSSFTLPTREVAELIVKEHGKSCNTHKEALKFLGLGELVTPKQEGVFRVSLEKEYLGMLELELEWKESDKAIIEAIEANEWEFTDAGMRWRQK